MSKPTEDDAGFSSAELDRLLAAPSPNAPLPPLPKGTSPNCSLLFEDGATIAVEAWQSTWEGAEPAVETYQLSVEKIGTLSLPSGKIVVRDFSDSLEGARPLDRSVPPGDYPVEVSIADHTCAAIRVLFQKNLKGPFSYYPAFEIDEPRHPDGGEIAVDGGNAAICDAEAFMRRSKREHACAIDLLLEWGPADSASQFVFLRLGKSATPNAVDVRSGHGDGGYPCYWVVEEGGRTVALVVDFLVVPQFLKRTVRKEWPKGADGIICELTTPEGKSLSVTLNRAENSVIRVGAPAMIRWLDAKGKWINDTSRLGSAHCGDETSWGISLSQLDESAAWFEVVIDAGYRNGGEARGEVDG